MRFFTTNTIYYLPMLLLINMLLALGCNREMELGMAKNSARRVGPTKKHGKAKYCARPSSNHDRYASKPPGDESLFQAINNGDFRQVERLLSRTNANTKDKEGTPALIWAIQKGQTEIARLLVKRGANVNSADLGGYPALIWAVAKRQKMTVEFLINRGANIYTKVRNGENALDWAQQIGETEIAQLLRDRGLSANKQYSLGVKPGDSPM
jgi:ankyrin repeat protein